MVQSIYHKGVGGIRSVPKQPAYYCLMHVSFEGPGMIRDYLNERNLPLHEVYLFNGAPVPPVDRVDYLIVMGGPMDTDEEDKYPWLKNEKK